MSANLHVSVLQRLPALVAQPMVPTASPSYGVWFLLSNPSPPCWKNNASGSQRVLRHQLISGAQHIVAQVPRQRVSSNILMIRTSKVRSTYYDSSLSQRIRALFGVSFPYLHHSLILQTITLGERWYLRRKRISACGSQHCARFKTSGCKCRIYKPWVI